MSVDSNAFERGVKFMYRMAGHGNVPYGDHRSELWYSNTVAIVPPNTRHGFRNVAETDSTLEFIVTPGGEIDEYFRRLTALLASGETDPKILNALGEEYGSINVAPPLAD